MVRETRHLWVGNLPDNIREDRIREHFKRYGRVQSVKLLPRCAEEKTGEITMACTVAFMDIKSASKAHNAELKIDDRTLNTEYYEPAAIPSAASPQNTPSPYSTSPGATRFPNGHGSSDEHGTFQERFYDRSTPRVATEGEFIRRTGYHDTSRGRNRDRSYRNGPYNSLMDRHSRTLNSSWTYDSTRYNSTTGCSQTDTGYNTTPSENNERRNSDQSTKKKTKSRSGSRSPSPSGSTSSRSPSRSRSRSSSSSSSSSTSRDTSSTSSPKSRRLTSSANTNHQPVVHSDDRRPLAICVKNLPLRSSDTSLKDGLFHEYKKHGKVTWVKVVGQNSERHAIVCFKKPEDVDKALEVSYDKLFFGCKIEVAPYQGYDVEDNDLRPYEAEIDEFHPKATRTLFIGNLEKDVTASDLRKHFDQFGEIIEIDIKKQGAVSSYAFCQYSDIVSVVKAIRKMDGEHLGNNRIKLGFGKSMAYNCVWIDGVNENVNEKYLRMQFEPFGVIGKVHIDREKGQALISYEQVLNAQAAVNKMRGFSLKNTKIQVDFASRECQESFFERLEKQGTVLDRTAFEERRDSTARTFDSTAAARFSRYDTPTRPRTSSYSSRSSAAASQVTSALQSPGTPGSVTPRGTGSRSRVARFAEYYEQMVDYPDRHFRSYDEYSQGSAASHEDAYEHEFVFAHESPTLVDPLDARSIQVVDTVVAFPPPDIRNLQKERVHLLEQLEECRSSGDEVMSPKKRPKLDLSDSTITGDVIIEANRDHRKVTEVRRLSDANLKHHSRRPSIDSGKHSTRDLGHDRSGYLPHAVCKRRKTAGSDSGSRVHHYDHSGSESVGGSRPGTPLCDERPENLQPSEPRRIPREREGPLTLPLPRFAAQVMNRGSVSVAGIKGQKDSVLSSPPAAVTSPRISNPRPPSPVHVPPPASPPPRPPSLSSNSSDSDVTPPSPSLEERIRSLDEKYEKWSGSRALSAAGGDALAMLDANREKFRLRHKLLDLDLKEVQPSEIVKSVMAKRSVFDEDLKRLENVGEKYEPKEFSLFPRSAAAPQTPVPATPLSAPPTLKLAPVAQLPKTPTMLSPRSAGAGLPAAKGLQYPFPTHPPVLMSPVPAPSQTPPSATTSSTPTPSPTVTSTTTATTTAAARGASHGENRLKPCASAASEPRTSSKVNVNRSTVVSSPLAPVKTSEKTNANIPNTGDFGASTKPKSSDKTTEKIACRRDSNSSSPRADVKTRRNSDTSARRIEDGDDSRERAKSEERKRERLEKARLENEKLEKERAEKERIERERLDKEKQEKERLEKERLEKERQERESELEKQRLEKERLEKERIEREKQEKERIEREQREKERLEQEALEKERKAREKKEREERERREREEQERLEALEKEKKERERKEKEEQERKEREEQEKREKEERERREEEERLEKEKLERERKREEERARHKEDNHDKRKDDHKQHRENHSETKHLYDSKNTKESSKEEKSGSHDLFRRDSQSRHHIERDAERRKESIKENRDNNIHDKHKTFNDIKDVGIRTIIESRHMSIDLDKMRNCDVLKQDPTKRKERNNSLPASIGSKRRLSSHESLDGTDESKRLKLIHENKKLSERRDSKDSTRSEDRSKSSKHKNNVVKSHDKHNSTKELEEKRKEKEREERHKKHKLEKQKSKSKSREKESRESPSTPKSPLTDKDFLARLDLRSTEEIEKQRKDNRESKEKRKDPIVTMQEEKDLKDKPCIEDRVKKEKQLLEKQQSVEKPPKSRSDPETTPKSSDERKKRDRIRKMTNSSDSDSDEPKKHSIFDIVDDEPAYISMYDKVKARSCKNMAKQEEEKRQEKIKAKFSQLKQSRAKREEKKRSTSWDEDSESDKDHSEMKIKRCPKMLIDSSDDENQERKSRKKKEIYSDSDSSAILRQIKREHDTSDDEIKNKNLIFKTSKSRITSDTSEDEYNKKKLQTQIKSELFSDTENANIQGFLESEEKPQLTKVKDELERLIKKERRSSKHQELPEMFFSDLGSPTPESKVEKFNNRNSFPENTSDEDTAEISKKERSERREKKHKKKQKKQKHSLSSEDSCKLENLMDTMQVENSEKSKHHEKKKEHGKKEKRRDKTREGREKSKKSKKNKSEPKPEGKREGKMENIFGSLSEDSENGKDVDQEKKSSTFMEKLNDGEAQHSESEHVKSKEKEERERDREEHKRRKEKKRREKERRLQEAAAAAAAMEQASNDNSMDYADMGKQLEANMLKDESLDASEEISKNELDAIDLSDDSFLTLVNKLQEIERDKEDRKEIKEKKKKRKKSKDEKSKHHNHHHHHHDKNKNKPPEFKKVEENAKTQNASLPTILDENSPSKTPDLEISPSTRETTPIISPIPKTPTTSKDKKRDKFIPGFGGEIDEKIRESAVKSISEFESIVKKEEIAEEETNTEKNQTPEEKPRVIISQEETEDAVAALLGESFGGGQFEECYNEEISNTNDQTTTLAEESNVQDDEEMRQAVQSLSGTDLDVKPETPQSEHELQIDTDTEEPEEISLRFDPKTPDLPDFSQPPKTPEIQRYFRNTGDEKALVLKSTPNIGSPPSLTPIKPAAVAEIRKNLDTEQKSLPMLPEQQQRSVISQPWSVEKQPEVPKTESSVIKMEPSGESPQLPGNLRPYATPPMVKITESSVYPALKAISKPDHVKLSPISDHTKVQGISFLQSPTTSQLHNLPARSPVQMNKPAPSVHDSGLLTPKPHNRLPITPVMVSKPLQPATVILQQSKMANSLELPKLVPTSEPRSQERPRMVFQTSTIQPPHFPSFAANQPRMMSQSNIRQLPPQAQGLLVPTRQLPPNSFSYLGNIPHPMYNLPAIIKENQTEAAVKIPHSTPVSNQPVSREQSPKPLAPLASPKVITSTPSPKPLVVSSPAPNSPSPNPAKIFVPTVPVISTESSVTHPKPVDEAPKTPALAPVIVPTSKEAVQEAKQVKVEEPPAKLAIEKVTDELNISLEKESPEVKDEKEPKFEDKVEDVEKPVEATKPEVKEEVKAVPEQEPVSVIKEIEKFEEEKADTESVVSDISKERSSADILAKDDPLDTKEDSDYWSAKEVNIDSVIKTLCSADELSDHSSENGKDEWFEDNKADSTKSMPAETEPAVPETKEDVVEPKNESDSVDEQKEVVTLRSKNNRGGRGRGRGKARGASVDRGGIQTRRAKLNKEPATPVPVPVKRGRGGRPKGDRKANKSESEAPTDVYEFRDEFDDGNKEQRPRLILTIKSPAVCSASNAQTTAIVKEVTKDGTKEIGKEQPKEIQHPVIKPVETKEEFASPATTNTRKSRRLQEKDTSRNTVDDTIEDVVKNTVQTRAAANQRRSARQAPKQLQPAPVAQPDTPRKSPRGRKPRRGSETAENSSSEETTKEENKPVPLPPKEIDKVDKELQKPLEKPHEGLKAAMLRRIKGELASVNQHEPTNLIDPVTGELIPMRECEEGKYIPLPGSAPNDQRLVIAKTKTPAEKPVAPVKAQPSVITHPQQVQQPKPQSFKAHVLSSQVAQPAVAQQLQAKPLTVPQTIQAPVVVSKAATPVNIPKTSSPVLVTKTVPAAKTPTPVVITKPVTPISQHLNVNTSLGIGMVSSAHLSPRPSVPLTVTAKSAPKPPVHSPVLALSNQQKQQILQVSKQQLTKGHMVTSMVTSPVQMVNTQLAHMKQHPQVLKQQVIMGKGPLAKPAHLQQQHGAVPSPPVSKSQSPARIIQGPLLPGAKGVMEPPKVDVSMANVMLGQRPKLSPQGQQRLVSQTGMPVPGYEASLGEAIAHFPPGPLRPPPDLNPAHYMHPSHVMQYQQFLRQQQLQHITRSGGIEKVGDGQEGEKAPVTSPPLELRRPGSVGLALTGRGAAVPHSLHSPHDRATDSPQVGQVYNVHSARMQHYHSNRYYDQTEPPPAHRPLTSHSSLAALGSDRGLAHMTPLGTPDRPLSGHSALSAHMGGLTTPDRPLSSHVERPLSAHGLMGAGLGAAGNLMGAVARHIGADAPTSQRGLQAATPPYASQVPPQAESLFMLLKHYPCMWQGLLALKNDQAAVQMYFVSGNDDVAKCSLPKNTDGSTPPLRIYQRMRFEPPQVEGVARKMQMENEHCMLLALPCGHDHMDVLKQSNNLTHGFITYLQLKQAAGIVNVAAPGTTQPPAYVVHIFPSCDFVNENLRRIAPSLLERVADIAHLLIVITTV